MLRNRASKSHRRVARPRLCVGVSRGTVLATGYNRPMAVVTKNTPETSSVAAKPRRRWYQFTLRTAGVWMALLCLLLGSFAWWRDRAERQRKVVEELRGLGATVDYRYFSLRNRNKPNEDKLGLLYNHVDEFFLCSFLRGNLGDDYVYDVGEVRFTNSIYDDAVPLEKTRSALLLLRKCPNLKELLIESNAIGGIELEQLACLESLERLVIFTRPKAPPGLLTDGDMKTLRRATSLKWLVLEGQPIGDKGVQHLTELQGLLELNLSRTHVTDQGLQKLSGLRSLTELNVEKTQVTLAGVKEYQSSSSCQLLYGSP
jgi:hypothetical protein